MYEKTKTVQFGELGDIREFVNAASKCDFDIDIKYNRRFIDAKSILGVMGIGIRTKFLVCYGGSNEVFQNIVDKLSIA